MFRLGQGNGVSRSAERLDADTRACELLTEEVIEDEPVVHPFDEQHTAEEMNELRGTQAKHVGLALERPHDVVCHRRELCATVLVGRDADVLDRLGWQIEEFERVGGDNH